MSGEIIRDRLPDRRHSITQAVNHRLSTDVELKMLVTFSFVSETDRRVREVFCADFKAGSDFHTLLIDASILLSKLLQHGYTPSMLLASLSEPRSMMGSILEAAVKLEQDLGEEA